MKRRNLQYTPDPQVPDDSFHLRDPDGYDLQVINEKSADFNGGKVAQDFIAATVQTP